MNGSTGMVCRSRSIAVFAAISVPEVLTSLQTGVVDGFDNSLLFTTATSWHSAIKHYAPTQHRYQPGAVVRNKAFLDMPEDLRKALSINNIHSLVIYLGRIT